MFLHSILAKDGISAMSKTQQRPVSPPVEPDKQTLTDYTANIQVSFNDLFQSAHDHLVLKKVPPVNSGKPQTISIVDDGTNVYIVVRTLRGWFKSANFTTVL
jgi:hypothetical protein